ncbi:MAG: EVE domain-containing protein [Phycisphaeraceae bacterium]|nr:EVE domain-containing protein [Phycisphaeraceae bacterium]
MASFLFKTEPGEYSFSDLVHEGTTMWSGVTNNAALGHLRSVRKGDRVFVYHTGDERAVVGLAKAVSGPYEDPANPGTNAAGAPKFAVVDLKPVKAARSPVTLDQVKADKRFAVPGFDLVRLPRLSVMPVPESVADLISTLAGL